MFMAQAQFIGSEIYRDSSYGRSHPLAIPRVSFATDIIRALNWFPDGAYVDSPMAEPEYLHRFHDKDYVSALMSAETDQDATDDVRRRYNIGVNGNPIFPEMFRRPATAVGGGKKAVELVRDGGTAFNIGGGQHHGRPDRASGFCYFNEPALTMGLLLEQGLERVFYLDFDAHHGDGVQDAFHDDERVFTMSVHEAGRWPMRRNETERSSPGGLHDRAGGSARNIPVPADLNDDEFEAVVEGVILPLIDDFAPEAIFIQCGVDALWDDPQSRLELSNTALWQAISKVSRLAPRIIASGGGGYNPYSVARGWAGVWAVLAGHEIPDELPDNVVEVLKSVTWSHRRARNPPDRWFNTLADPPNHGPIRDEIRELIRTASKP